MYLGILKCVLRLIEKSITIPQQAQLVSNDAVEAVRRFCLLAPFPVRLLEFSCLLGIWGSVIQTITDKMNKIVWTSRIFSLCGSVFFAAVTFWLWVSPIIQIYIPPSEQQKRIENIITLYVLLPLYVLTFL